MPEKRVAIVTGGAGGIGLGIADTLADAGFNVIVFDISKERLAALDTARLTGMQVDVTSEPEVTVAVDNIIKRFGAIHVLVNNAGTIYNEPLINIMNREQPRHSFETFKKNVDINLNAVFLVGSVVAEKMVLKRTPGVIINISSISASGNAGQTAYSAAKAGVRGHDPGLEQGTRSFRDQGGYRGTRIHRHGIDEEGPQRAETEGVKRAHSPATAG